MKRKIAIWLVIAVCPFLIGQSSDFKKADDSIKAASSVTVTDGTSTSYVGADTTSLADGALVIEKDSLIVVNNNANDQGIKIVTSAIANTYGIYGANTVTFRYSGTTGSIGKYNNQFRIRSEQAGDDVRFGTKTAGYVESANHLVLEGDQDVGIHLGNPTASLDIFAKNATQSFKITPDSLAALKYLMLIEDTTGQAADDNDTSFAVQPGKKVICGNPATAGTDSMLNVELGGYFGGGVSAKVFTDRTEYVPTELAKKLLSRISIHESGKIYNGNDEDILPGELRSGDGRNMSVCISLLLAVVQDQQREINALKRKVERYE